MIEERFDLKHLDRITQYLDKHLSEFPKREWKDDGSFEYFFEDNYAIGPGPIPSTVSKLAGEFFGLIFLKLSIIPDEGEVKITIIPQPRGRFGDLIGDLKSLIVWSGALTCPHCKARYVYKDTDLTEGSTKCKNCAKSFDVS